MTQATKKSKDCRASSIKNIYYAKQLVQTMQTTILHLKETQANTVCLQAMKQVQAKHT